MENCFNTLLYIIFQYGWELVLIQWILIGLEAVLRIKFSYLSRKKGSKLLYQYLCYSWQFTWYQLRSTINIFLNPSSLLINLILYKKQSWPKWKLLNSAFFHCYFFNSWHKISTVRFLDRFLCLKLESWQEAKKIFPHIQYGRRQTKGRDTKP